MPGLRVKHGRDVARIASSRVALETNALGLPVTRVDENAPRPAVVHSSHDCHDGPPGGAQVLTKRSVGAWLIVAGLIFGLVPGPASADSGSVTDPDDTPGALDVRSISYGHSDGGLVTHRLVMWNNWKNGTLRGSASKIILTFNTDEDSIKERGLTIDIFQGSLFAEMRCYCGGREVIVGYAKVWRPDAASIKVAIPKRLLKKSLASYRWRASTYFATSSHPICHVGNGVQTMCRDVSPNRSISNMTSDSPNGPVAPAWTTD